MIKDYEIKIKLLSTNGVKTLAHCKNRVNHILHKSRTLLNYSESQRLALINEYHQCRNIIDNTSDVDYRVANNMMRARQMKSARVRKYIEMMFNIFKTSKLYFVSLTFNDDVLSSTSETTRRKYLIRYLKSINDYYIANIDYGKKNEREHYHCIIPIKDDDIEVFNAKKNIYHNKGAIWKYGFETCKCINREIDDLTRISIYIDKFANHTIKETTKNTRVIYSDELKYLMKCKL